MPRLAPRQIALHTVSQSTPLPVRRTQAERSAATRARLVEAATDALNRLGYSATSTVLVADSARVSRGAMLHQFPTKAVLMAAVVEASYAADLAAYQQATAGIADPVDQLMAIIEAGWVQFRAPSGIAQTEIWMATRSDAELAAVVLPIHEAIFANSQATLAARFAAAGVVDPIASEAFLNFAIATLRGLSLEHALGTPAAQLRPSISLLKNALHLALNATEKTSS